MALKAHEHPLKKVFSSDFDLVIPDYQRPYAWGPEQALQLLDDLQDALERGGDGPYFLGSLVLVKPKEELPSSDVIDGQQRLTTLSILFSVLRDLAEDDEISGALREWSVSLASYWMASRPSLVYASASRTRPSSGSGFRTRGESVSSSS